jgi:hypothetical protein
MAIHYDIMNTIIICSFVFLIQCWSMYYKHMKIYYDDKYLTPKDYTILMKGLPSKEENLNFNVKKKLKRKLKALGYKVKQINLVYDPEFFQDTYRGLTDARIELSKFVYEVQEGLQDEVEQEDLKVVKGLEEDILINKQKVDYIEEALDGRLIPQFEGQAFVSFNTEKMKRDFVRGHAKYGCCYQTFGCGGKVRKNIYMEEYPDQLIYCRKAPEPNDIVWENLKYTQQNRV